MIHAGHAGVSMPDMPAMPPMPMSRMVRFGTGLSGGAPARIPARGARVATAMPDRSMASATTAKARSSVGRTMTS
jgi:hypothetical protein